MGLLLQNTGLILTQQSQLRAFPLRSGQEGASCHGNVAVRSLTACRSWKWKLLGCHHATLANHTHASECSWWPSGECHCCCVHLLTVSEPGAGSRDESTCGGLLALCSVSTHKYGACVIVHVSLVLQRIPHTRPPALVHFRGFGLISSLADR